MRPALVACVCVLVGAMACDELGNPPADVAASGSLHTLVQTAKLPQAPELLAGVPPDALDFQDTTAGPGFAIALVQVQATDTTLVGPTPLRTLFVFADGSRIQRTWTMLAGAGARYGFFALPATPVSAQTQVIRR